MVPDGLQEGFLGGKPVLGGLAGAQGFGDQDAGHGGDVEGLAGLPHLGWDLAAHGGRIGEGERLVDERLEPAVV